MNQDENILDWAKYTLEKEAEAISSGVALLNEDFAAVVQRIHDCRGRLIVTAIGKSAAIAKKIVATLNSMGTASIFMHASEAVHGDLGVLRSDDCVLCVSNSGNSPEIKALIPFIKVRSLPLFAIVGNVESYLANAAELVIPSTVKSEVLDEIAAPTSSTILQLAIGDALAVCLAKLNGFSPKDFALAHPGGSLGKQMTLTIGELISPDSDPIVQPEDPVNEVIVKITSNRVGAVAVVEHNVVKGIITDGDIRRMLQNDDYRENTLAKDLMSKNPRKVDADALASSAWAILQETNISQIIVVDGNEHFKGIVHFHDLMKEGF